MKVAELTATSSLRWATDSYIYQILTTKSHVAAISSDDSLRLVDPTTLQEISVGSFSAVHAGVTSLKSRAEGSDVLMTAGRDAVVKGWDLRTGAQTSSFGDGANAPYLSLACNERFVAAGIELSNHQAAVSIWDHRNSALPLRRYVESHNDDVTELAFHPTNPQILLSGSTDSLINIYNTTQPDEDDALLSITNHGSSIHHAGFLPRNQIFGLSHDETFSIYQLDETQRANEAAPGSGATPFGDLREKLECEYVVDVSYAAGNILVAAGSHSNQYIDIVPLHLPISTQSQPLDEENTLRLPGAHGEEIVRSICYVDSTVFTAGEDGCIRAWRGHDASGESEAHGKGKKPEDGELASKKKKRRKDGDGEGGGVRFKPY